jgi:hypothetical protein
MARVFGSSDEQQVNYYKSILEDNDLHVFIYNKTASPFSEGVSEHILTKGHLVGEIKLMVPCSEVLKAEKIIDEIQESSTE